MREHKDAATIQRLRSDVALQIARFLGREQLSQAAAAKLLHVPQPTISRIVSGRVAGLSLELLLRIAVRAGLHLVLQIGAVPEEAGAFLSGTQPTTRKGPRSRLADDVGDAQLAAIRQMTPEQRLNAHLELSEFVASLYRAGSRSR